MAALTGTGVTDAARQILLEVGAEGNQLLASVVMSLIPSYEDKGDIDPRLQFLYAKRQVIDILIGHTWQLVDQSAESAKTSLSEKIANLQEMRGDCQDEIGLFEKTDRASRPGAIGVLAQTAPRLVPCGCIDPNSDRFRGDPLCRW